MKKISKWISAVLLLLVFGFAAVKIAERFAVSPVTASPSVIEPEATASTAAGVAGGTIEAGEVGYEMKFAENDHFMLLGNADGSIAVLNKADGFLYESNPQTQDPLAIGINMTNLKSQLYISWTDKAGSATTKNSTTDCVNKGWLSYNSITGGVRYIYDFQNVGIVIPVEYRLTEKGLTASIVVEEIQENTEETGLYLTNITLLPFFGAASTENDGYILVPDGSGSLIYFNNDKATYGGYSQYVYGRDSALVIESLTEDTETARLPVFGITNGTDGYLAVITDGDAKAIVNAMTSGTVNSYNNVYASFTYRAFTRSTFLEGNTYASNGTGGDTTVSLTLSPVVSTLPAYSVEYLLLSGEEVTYVDMAKAYRTYLIEHEGMAAQGKETSAPFYLKLLGGLEVDEYVLGIKRNILKPLTTYSQAQQILGELQELGIDNLAVNYSGWQKGGMDSAIPSKIKFESKLGGKRKYQKLEAFTEKNGIKLFMDFDFVNLYQSGNGYSKNSDAAQTVGATPAYQYTYDLNLLSKQISGRWKLLTPSKVQTAVEGMLKNASKLEGAQVALSSLSNMLYSDYAAKKNGIDRSDAKVVWKELFGKAAESFSMVMADNGNSYTFPYVSHIYNVPLNSSGYDIEDEAVPFYQIVLHGYISYSTEPINLSAMPQQLILKAVETGSSLSACLMYAENEALLDTKYDDYFSCHYGAWGEVLAEYYLRTKEVLNLVAQAEITDHKEVLPNVYCTVYSNGVSVYVNYNATAAAVNGMAVPANDFVYVQEGWK